MPSIVIPARLASTRLPEKLLLRETGKSLLQHTFESASRSSLAKRIIIAVDDKRLFDEATLFNATPLMTDINAQSGTDRVAEVAKAFSEEEIWVNVQGDEPEIEGSSIDLVIRLLIENPRASVATLSTPIKSRENFEDPNCVKVVRNGSGEAMYFSRSPIPFPRKWSDDLLTQQPPLVLQHLGIYAYRKAFLERLPELSISRLEQTEKLEQLRFIEAGYSIAVGVIDEAPRGIDTRPDYDAFVTRTLTAVRE